MNNPTCPKCGSTKIVPRAKVLDRGENNWRGELELQVSANPEALIFTGNRNSTLYARVCAGCSNVEFLADDAQGLWDAYQESLRRK